MPKFPPKPAVPSVRETVGPAIARSRTLSRDEQPLSRQDLVKDLITKLDLPPALEAQLRRRHKLDD